MENKLEELKIATEELGQSIANLKELFIKLAKALDVNKRLVYSCENCGLVCDRSCDNCQFCVSDSLEKDVPF